ncbi:FAD-dependent oxidoreductase [Streptomyces sp. ITFR-6]|uniref:FAD-dependent oxidoreductase n=1 Tax=Streptomyces sp. ITFR-6 TaxID=3075197 RepID=UPI00288A6148|nr:FAD-dependent oxidoreductase [Streptomyces sp. ITFR-6]WNI28257.1 FAD-dependent oxidoreductase [Streptomyces sp. ITFR-6]
MAKSSDAPVVVLGGGLAGYSAAIEAAERGARVLVIDKAAEPGGSTLRSGGSFAFAGTDLQAAHGIEDSDDLLRRDLLRGGGEQSDPQLVDLYVRRQLAAYHWLKRCGVDFDGVSLSGNQSVPRSHGVDIGRSHALIRAAATAHHSVTELLATTTEALTQENGRIVGVVTRDSDGTATERPARAVVLATGGFARSRRAISTFAPQLSNARRMGGEHNTGDGMYLAMSVGADLADVGTIKATFGVTADVPGMPPNPTLLNALYRGGIVVNSRAERFVDESISYKLIGGVCLQQPGGLGVQIFDEQVMEQTIPGKLVNNYRGALEQGYLLQADSIRELAVAAGLDPDALAATVDGYNDAVRSTGDTDFGRTHLSSGYGELPTINRAPYYAYPTTAGLTSTYGGLRVDVEMRVAHVLGGTVPGLYAAGEIVGGFHGNAYMSGSSLGKSVIFGRAAGRGAADTPM